MKKFKLVGSWPRVQGNPKSGIFTNESLVKEYASKLNLSYVEIDEPKSMFDNIILY